MWIWLKNLRIFEKEKRSVETKKSDQYENQKHIDFFVNCLKITQSLPKEKASEN